MPMIPVDTAVNIMVGPLIDDTDFKARETGVAFNAAGMDVDLLKSSDTGVPTTTAITLTSAGANDWVELSGGYYYVELTAAQNNVEGKLKLIGIATGILPFESIEYDVVPTQVYNSLVAGSDSLDVEVASVAANAITAAAIATGAIDADAIAANAITAAKIATDAIGAAQIAANAIGASEIATDAIGSDQFAAGAVTDIWANVCETNGSRTAQQILSVVLAAVAGVTSSGGAVFSDPAGTSTRISATVNGSNERTAITLTPSS